MTLIRKQTTSRSGNAHAFVAVRRHGCGDLRGKPSSPDVSAGASVRHPRDAMMTAFIGLHLLEILLWAGFIVALFRSWDLPFTSRLPVCDRWLRRCRSSVDLADLGSSGKHHWRADVRVFGELPVRRREQAVDREVRASDTPSQSRETYSWNEGSPRRSRATRQVDRIHQLEWSSRADFR